jgi:hypothetical protein
MWEGQTDGRGLLYTDYSYASITKTIKKICVPIWSYRKTLQRKMHFMRCFALCLRWADREYKEGFGVETSFETSTCKNGEEMGK